MRFLSHFQQPIYACIGDILDLAIQRTPNLIPEGECLMDNRKTRSGSQYERTSSGVRARRRNLAWWRLTDTWGWFTHFFFVASGISVGIAFYASTAYYFALDSTRNIFTVCINSGFGTPFRVLWSLDLFGGILNSGALVAIFALIGITVHLFVGQWAWMPAMNGSIRVVLASCTKLTAFSTDGIGWGDISQNCDEMVAGFGASVKPLVEGAIYPANMSGEQPSEISQHGGQAHIGEMTMVSEAAAPEEGEVILSENVE
jgi:hypothetical protein